MKSSPSSTFERKSARSFLIQGSKALKRLGGKSMNILNPKTYEIENI